jgi:hypothetical protein
MPREILDPQLSAEQVKNQQLREDINKLKDPERYNDISLDIASTQQAIDILDKLRRFVAREQGGGKLPVAFEKLYHAAEHLSQDLKAKFSEGNKEE